MSEGERTPYEVLAVQLGMAKKALCGNANATHEQLRAACEAVKMPGGTTSACPDCGGGEHARGCGADPEFQPAAPQRRWQ